MSALPRSIGYKVLAPALRPSAARALAPRYRTYATKDTTPEDAPAVKLTSDSTQIREEGAAEGMRHQPDYNVAIDYRTSFVSPRWFAGKAS
jgi:NADH dehydrogenase (ubiquinone) Fe-S protein 4